MSRLSEDNQQKQSGFGLVAIALHWAVAILTVLLFALGYWMVTLDYYSSWYQIAPQWHKNFGVLVSALVTVRWLWYRFKSRPEGLVTMTTQQLVLSRIAHISMDILIMLLAVSGYLMVTAQGQSLIVFDIFLIPAVLDNVANLEDSAGLIHCYLAYTIIVLATGHSLVALKHHYFDKDATLLRMIGRNHNQSL